MTIKDHKPRADKALKESEVCVKGLKVNIRQYAIDNGICWTTAKKRLEGKCSRKPRVFKGKGKLDSFKDVIDFKVENWNCSATSIFWLIKDKGFTGSLSLVIKYVKKKKDLIIKAAVLRVESTPGLQGQTDWKESMTLVSRGGESFTINIFLFILSYSKYKYIELTIDRRQETLFNCMVNCFRYLGGVPEEIWFDNMKTVVDYHDINTNRVDFNVKFAQFAKDAQFNPIACRPYRPCTKGIVENLAKIMDRLKAYNMEFDDYDDLGKIVVKLNKQLNEEEVCQATGKTPSDKFLNEEKEYLNQRVNLDQFDYKPPRQVRKVSGESMVNYDGKKYSVPTAYLKQLVEIEATDDDSLHIYYNGEEIRTHKLSNQRFNYNYDDLKEIVAANYKSYSEEQVEEATLRRLKGYDFLLRGGSNND